MAVLHDPWTGKTVHEDALASPVVVADENGDYIIHRENGKTSYKAYEGGSGLPEVTADDNGDVLTVVSGEWAKAAPSGGGGVLIVGIDVPTMALDKTWQEIVDAGFAVIAMTASGATNYAYLISTQHQSDFSYEVNAFMIQNGAISPTKFVATSADGYPVLQND